MPSRRAAAFALGGSAAPTLDTSAKLGTEGRVEGMAAGGDRVQGTIGLLYAARIVFADPATRVRHAGGMALQVLPVVRGPRAEHSVVRVGARLSGDAEGGGGEPIAGVFSLALVVRWVTFDTTHAD